MTPAEALLRLLLHLERAETFGYAILAAHEAADITNALNVVDRNAEALLCP